MTEEPEDTECFFALYDGDPMEARPRYVHSTEGLDPDIVDALRRFDSSTPLAPAQHDDDSR